MTVEGLDETRAQALQQGLSAGAATSWQVELNLDVLRRIATPDGARAGIRADTPLAGNHLDLEIPGQVQSLRLLLDTVYEGYGGVVNYAGVIEGDDGSLVAISVDGSEVLGKIHHSVGFTYLIASHHGQRGYALSVIDQTLVPRPTHRYQDDRDSAHNDQVISRPMPELDDDIALPASASGNVRLLVLYTPLVAAQTNVSLMANNIVSGFNQSLQLSGVDSNNYVTLAGVRSIGNSLSTQGRRCNDEIVDVMMTQRSGPFSDLDDWMELAYADIALAIVTTEPGYTECGNGAGRFGGRGLPISQYPGHTRPFSNTTDTFALADLTAIHEVGHVLNGMHAHLAHCNWGTIPSYACGYAPQHCQWQTMMGGYVQCGFDHGKDPWQQPTVRIARWSNPDRNYNGEPTGIPVPPNQSGGRHMAAALDINMSHAAGWKGTQSTPPSAPDPISTSSFYCWGMTSVNWAAQTGTVEYRLFRSSSSSFTHPVLMYSGPKTATTVNVDQTSYLRVKACNSGGCSPYSSQAVAFYYSACM